MARSSNSSDGLLTTTTPVTGPPTTMACWFRTTSMAQDAHLVGIYDSATANQMQAMLFRGNIGGDPIGAFSFDGGVSIANSTTGATSGVWHHALATWASATDRRAYIDGGSEGTESTSRTPAGIDRIGIARAADSSPSNTFTGDFAEVAIWNVVLSAASRAILAAGYSPLFVEPANLVFYMPGVREIALSEDRDIVGGLTVNETGSVLTSEHPRIINAAPRPSIFVPVAVAPSGRIMSSLVSGGGLAGPGGIAGKGGGLAA